jgi:hypothetical protein
MKSKEIQYEGDLANVSEQIGEEDKGGIPFSPMQEIWEVNPGAEAVESDKPQTEEEA